MRGIHTQIVTALGSTPAFFSGVLSSQTAALLAGELDERARLPVVVIDQAHLLTNTDLEALRMLTNADMDTGSHFAMLLVGQPNRRSPKTANSLPSRVTTTTSPSLSKPGRNSAAGLFHTRASSPCMTPPSSTNVTDNTGWHVRRIAGASDMLGTEGGGPHER